MRENRKLFSKSPRGCAILPKIGWTVSRREKAAAVFGKTGEIGKHLTMLADFQSGLFAIDRASFFKICTIYIDKLKNMRYTFSVKQKNERLCHAEVSQRPTR